jgi:signal transduction histidine kinase
MRAPSLRRRVTIAAAAAILAAVAGVDAFTYLSFQRTLRGDLHARLAQRARDAALTHTRATRAQLAVLASAPGIVAVVPLGDGVVSGKPLYPCCLGVDAVEPLFYTAAQEQTELGRVRDLVTYRAYAFVRGRRVPVLYVASGAQIERTLDRLLAYELAGSAVVLLLGLALARRLARGALRPLDDLVGIASDVQLGDFSRRARPDRAGTDVGTLGVAFDRMLEAVEDAVTRARSSEGRMKGLVADASHELRTPLAGIYANVELLLAQTPDPATERLVLRIASDARRARRLVDDLLLVSRIEEGLAPERTVTDVAEVVREEAEAAEARHVEVAVTARLDTDVHALVDEAHLRQILANLLENACHAVGPRGCVHARAHIDRGVVLVTVDDDGPGVPPAERERIFERFVRLDRARSRDRFGSGLGLAIARGLAEANDGTLDCVDVERGARFRLVLRLAPAREPSRPVGGVASPATA